MAVEFCKSAFISFGFFGTLCIRPATKSEISARALTREETASLVRKTVGFVDETLISSRPLVKEKWKEKV